MADATGGLTNPLVDDGPHRYHLVEDNGLVDISVNSLVNKPTKRPRVAVDTLSHGGLRGVAAVWIMVFHAVMFSTVSFDLQGSSIMPLFFVLSGFSMQLAYGKAAGAMPFECGGNYARFVQNRLARTYPTYFAASLYAIPLWVLKYYGDGTASLVQSLVSSLLLISTAVLLLLQTPLDPPAWTICTLFVFWLYFPVSARKAAAMTDEALARGIVHFFYVQFAFVALVFTPLFILLGYPAAFAISTMNPWTRYPVFLMGVYAGELCQRHPTTQPSQSTDPLPPGISPMPWPSTVLLFFPCRCGGGGSHTPPPKKNWIQVADNSSMTLLCVTLLVATADAIYAFCFSEGGNIGGGLWLQALAPFLQLAVVVALTRDGARSMASGVLRHPKLLWLGDISMAIYLVHHPTIFYFVWGAHGFLPVHPPATDDCKGEYGKNTTAFDKCQDETKDYLMGIKLPIEYLPAVVAASLVLAQLLYWFVEEPGRKALRSSTPAAK